MEPMLFFFFLAVDKLIMVHFQYHINADLQRHTYTWFCVEKCDGAFYTVYGRGIGCPMLRGSLI